MKKKSTLILGGGMTGLAAGVVSQLPVYEAQNVPGGICSSYYLAKGIEEPLFKAPDDQEAYRFEIGGGHWIFGGDPKVLNYFSEELAQLRLPECHLSIYTKAYFGFVKPLVRDKVY